MVLEIQYNSSTLFTKFVRFVTFLTKIWADHLFLFKHQLHGEIGHGPLHVGPSDECLTLTTDGPATTNEKNASNKLGCITISATVAWKWLISCFCLAVHLKLQVNYHMAMKMAYINLHHPSTMGSMVNLNHFFFFLFTYGKQPKGG